jgi:hypothetical protein
MFYSMYNTILFPYNLVHVSLIILIIVLTSCSVWVIDILLDLDLILFKKILILSYASCKKPKTKVLSFHKLILMLTGNVNVLTDIFIHGISFFNLV